MERLTDLEVFLAVVENASFSGAADALGISRSYASRCVADLEGRLGARLLHRTTRHVSTTTIGRQLYDQVAPLVAGVADAEARVREEASAPEGTLYLSLPAAFGSQYLIEPTLAFAAAHPKIRLVVQYDDRKTDIAAEGIDLAIRGGTINDDNLVAQRLWPFRVLVVATPAWADAHPVDHPRAFATLPCITHGAGEAPHRWWFRRGDTHEVVRVRSAFVSNHTSQMAAAARAGLGCVSIPEWAVADALRAGTLVQLLPEWEVPELWWSAVRPARQPGAARVRAYIQHLTDLWRTPPWVRPAP